MSGDNSLKFMMIVNDPDIARFVSKNGVDRLFVDLEVMGKQERQGHLNTVKSTQTIENVSTIRHAVSDAHLLVRINPLHKDSQLEIDEVVDRGADSVMLPMFRTTDEVAVFLDMLAGRTLAVPLVETVTALAAIPNMIAKLKLSELFIGLNDLHLDAGMSFMFEPMAKGMLDTPCKKMGEAGISFGIGGIAKTGEGYIKPQYLMGEHVRLGSSRVILSRSFQRGLKTIKNANQTKDFTGEVDKLQMMYRQFLDKPVATLEQNRILVIEQVNQAVNSIKKGRV